MKITDEGLDFPDCMPGPSTYPEANIDRPDYIKAGIQRRQDELRQAAEAKTAQPEPA